MLFFKKQITSRNDVEDKELSYKQFIRWKIVVWVYFVFWLSLGLYLITNWFDLPKYFSWPLAIIEALIVPDMNVFKELFRSFKGAKSALNIDE